MRKAVCMDEETANKIFDILVEECGAPAEVLNRALFVNYFTAGWSPPLEWRFMGKLGFGGKFHISSLDEWYVTCYVEDSNEERVAMMYRAKMRLDKLQAEVDSAG